MDEYLMQLKKYSDFSTDIGNVEIAFQSYTNPELKNIRDKYKLSEYYQGETDLQKMLLLMNYIHNELFFIGSNVKPKAMNTNDIMDVKKTGSVFCSCYSTVFSEMLLSMGVKAIKISCLPKTFDCDCHVAVMAFVIDIGKWVFLDPTFDTYFHEEEGVPLDIFEIRKIYKNDIILPTFRHITIDKQWKLFMNGIEYETYDQWYLAYMSKNIFRFMIPQESSYNYTGNEKSKYIFINPIGYTEKNEYDDITASKNITYTDSMNIFRRFALSNDNANHINLLSAGNVGEYSEVIRQSFDTVAKDFNLTKENCPRHPSFYTNNDLENKINANYFPFGYFIDNKFVGFVSLNDKGNGVFSLNNLAVLPEYRHLGIGKILLEFCKDRVKEHGGNKIEIEIIENNAALRSWYSKNGFVHIGTKKFDHLPFTVGFMEMEV
ncbi:MAG: GNAT family N-acetyltransferase [Saccharofermentanales bacterium]